VIRQLLPHLPPGEVPPDRARCLRLCWVPAGYLGPFRRRLARARPRDVRAPLRARPVTRPRAL